MTNDLPIVLIVALLPLVAGLVIVQANPYHALVMRGVLGAVAALVESLLGAADVALTEALVGTMLAITLYAVAVRSSLVYRLGIFEQELESSSLLEELRTILGKRYLRLEVISYPSQESLETALVSKEIHGTCERARMQTRIARIYEILQSELTSGSTNLTYLKLEEQNR